MAKLSKREKRKIQNSSARTESDDFDIDEELKVRNSKKRRNKMVVVVSVVLVFLIIGGYSVYSFTQPGKYDEFAKCLSEKGVVMYGATWCQYTKAQEGMFGKSFKYLDYKDYSEGTGIRVTPTWDINGERYEKVQSFETLSEATGCPIS